MSDTSSAPIGSGAGVSHMKMPSDAPRLSADFPVRHIILLVTEECNLRCTYCYIRKQPRVMDQATAKASVDFLFENAPDATSPVSLTFFGGEPLLAPEMVEWVHGYATRRAEQAGREIWFSMTSNATLFTAKNTELIRRLGIDVRLSLDGIEEAHDLHRKTISGRGSFRLFKKQLSHIKTLPHVSVRLTVSPDTAKDLPDSIRWLGQQGFRSISYATVTEADWDEASLAALYEAQLEIYNLEAEIPRSALGHVHKMRHALESCGSRWGCGAARNMVAIDAKGFIYPCHRFIGYFRNGPKQRIGHVMSGLDETVREKYIAANHSSGRKGCGHGLFESETPAASKSCDNCSLLQVCGSNCMAVNEYMTGDPARPDPINRVLSQIDVATHFHEAQDLKIPV